MSRQRFQNIGASLALVLSDQQNANIFDSEVFDKFLSRRGEILVNDEKTHGVPHLRFALWRLFVENIEHQPNG